MGTLQQTDITLVRLANMGNRQASDEIGKLMDAKGVPLSEVSDTLNEYCQNLGEAAKAEADEIRRFLSVMVRRSNGDAGAIAETVTEASVSGAPDKKEKKDIKDSQKQSNDERKADKKKDK